MNTSSLIIIWKFCFLFVLIPSTGISQPGKESGFTNIDLKHLSFQKKEDQLIRCKISFNIENETTNVAACYINFNTSTLEIIETINIPSSFSLLSEVSNLHSLTEINKKGQIDIILTRPPLSVNKTKENTQHILEIIFKSSSDQLDIANDINLNTEFPRKTSLAYEGIEIAELLFGKQLDVKTVDGTLIKSIVLDPLTMGKEAANEKTSGFHLRFTATTPETQLALTPTGNLTNMEPELTAVKNSPNPFANSTTIFYQLTRESTVQIELFNQYGLLTKRISSGRRPPGNHQITLSGQELPAGIYFCRLLADSNPLKTLKLIKL